MYIKDLINKEIIEKAASYMNDDLHKSMMPCHSKGISILKNIDCYSYIDYRYIVIVDRITIQLNN